MNSLSSQRRIIKSWNYNDTNWNKLGLSALWSSQIIKNITKHI